MARTSIVSGCSISRAGTRMPFQAWISQCAPKHSAGPSAACSRPLASRRMRVGRCNSQHTRSCGIIQMALRAISHSPASAPVWRVRPHTSCRYCSAPSQAADWKLKPLPAKLARVLRRGKKSASRVGRIGSARSPSRSMASSTLAQKAGRRESAGLARQRHAHARARRHGRRPARLCAAPRRQSAGARCHPPHPVPAPTQRRGRPGVSYQTMSRGGGKPAAA